MLELVDHRCSLTMGDKVPLSELTLGEADSFLENLICQTQGSGGWFYSHSLTKCQRKFNVVVSDLNTAGGVDLSDEDRALQVAEELESTHEKYKTGHEVITGIMSKFDVGSTVAALGTTVAEIEPEAVMTATCVVLSAASNLASMKFPDLTMHKVLASLQNIEGKLDQILAAPLKMAIDGYDTVVNAVITKDFERAYGQLQHRIRDARQAFHYADKKNIGIESFRYECHE